MSKPRKIKNKSIKYTDILNIDGLEALSGSTDYYIKAQNADTEMPLCIECHGPVKNHGRFRRDLIDIVEINQQRQFARLSYHFYKYRCLSETCSTVFQKEPDFVKESAKVTRRYEDEVMHYVMYESIDNARIDMQQYIVDGHTRDLISKPAMSKLIKRWVDDKDENRKFVAQAIIAMYACHSKYASYIVICDNKDNLIEVLPEVSDFEIRKFFGKVDPKALYGIVIDCDPIINETVRTIVPADKIYIDTNTLKLTLYNEYRDYIYERLKRYHKNTRDLFLRNTVELEVEESIKVRGIERGDPELREVHRQYGRLYSILSNKKDITPLNSWQESLTVEIEPIFAYTSEYIKAYWKEFLKYNRSVSKISDSTFDKIHDVSEKVALYFPVSTPEVLRARLLYSSFTDTSQGVWKGIPLDNLITNIDNMISEGGLEKHER